MSSANDPKARNVTIYGRLSWPVWTITEALARDAKSTYPAANKETVTAEFNLVLDQPQLDKFKRHILDVFLPHCVQNSIDGEKRNAFTQAEADAIRKVVESDWEDQPPYIPIKPLHEKTAAMAPDAVCQIKVKGPRAADIVLKAIVNDESELAVPDPDVMSFPIVRPITQTVHSMYPGCFVAATLNLYGFLSGKKPGFSASASTAIFKADGDRFGGGVDFDEDEIFLD